MEKHLWLHKRFWNQRHLSKSHIICMGQNPWPTLIFLHSPWKWHWDPQNFQRQRNMFVQSFKKVCVCVCLCVCMHACGHSCTIMHVWKSKNKLAGVASLLLYGFQGLKSGLQGDQPWSQPCLHILQQLCPICHHYEGLWRSRMSQSRPSCHWEGVYNNAEEGFSLSSWKNFSVSRDRENTNPVQPLQYPRHPARQYHM